MNKYISIKDFRDMLLELNRKVFLERNTAIAIIKGIAGLPRIEASDDAISREYIVKKLKSTKEFYLSAWESFSDMDDKDKARCDELDNCIATVINAPPVIPKRSCYRCGLREDCADSSVAPQAKEGEWIIEYNGNGWNDYWDYTCPSCGKKYERADAVLYKANFCPECGAKMKGVNDGC